ncbi:hypothetical protein JW865_04950 [Candidatus Bathyarchaeota archaeon]|nr:hypothetical protein [Candidatus Bathyarchaeota archaeon]
MRKDNELSESERLFLDTLSKYGLGHVTENNLKLKLVGMGFDEEDFNKIKRKLLFRGYIGLIYGNITLEKKLINDK